MAKTKEKRQKKKGRSTQELIGVKSFTKYGLETQKGELLFYLVGPTNISVLSRVNIEIKIRHLMMVLSAIPDIEIACTDSCECFDDNKSYLQERMDEEQNPKVRRILKKDMEMLDHVQAEMSTARQFLFILRCKGMKPEQIFQTANRTEKVISEQGFEVRRMKKADICSLYPGIREMLCRQCRLTGVLMVTGWPRLQDSCLSEAGQPGFLKAEEPNRGRLRLWSLTVLWWPRLTLTMFLTRPRCCRYK